MSVEIPYDFDDRPKDYGEAWRLDPAKRRHREAEAIKREQARQAKIKRFHDDNLRPYLR